MLGLVCEEARSRQMPSGRAVVPILRSLHQNGPDLPNQALLKTLETIGGLLKDHTGSRAG